MKVQYINDQPFGIDPAPFASKVKHLETLVDAYLGIVNVVFVNDKYIQALNKQYRGKDKPTDVLSFDYEVEKEAKDDLAGEVYISVETAQRQADELGHGLQDEVLRLLIHGLLHIHGYDHETDEEYQEMNGLERGVLGVLAEKS
jgi:probable rRNA maturation factor